MTQPYISKIGDNDPVWKYALPAGATAEGHLAVSSGHEIYWAEYGNPKGEAVMFLHGGPGGGSSVQDARFFDPLRYRIVLFDQRGCGKSRPHVAHDPKAGLTDNDTPHLIEDIEALRVALGITGKMHVFGGSWGSTLALAYAIAYPAHVASLVLRGIFLVRKIDLDFFYQGNAADLNNRSLGGTYMFYPEAWKAFVERIPPAERGDMVAAYARIFNAEPQTEGQVEALKAWTRWEDVTSYLSQPDEPSKFDEVEFAKAFARIENHYFMNGCFLGGKSGESWRNNNFLIENAGSIAHIPIRIVQGQYDMVCPRFGADDLIAALHEAGARDVEYALTTAGHSRYERENVRILTEFMDQLEKI